MATDTKPLTIKQVAEKLGVSDSFVRSIAQSWQGSANGSTTSPIAAFSRHMRAAISSSVSVIVPSLMCWPCDGYVIAHRTPVL